MTSRAYNFSAGPSVLPEPVLEQARKDLWDIDGTGVGVCEQSHRGKVADRIFAEAEADCRKVGSIPDNYRVLFLQGGASTQFWQVPAHFLPDGGTADYFDTGNWASHAIEEAALYGHIHIAGSSKEENYSYLPKGNQIQYSASPAYVHFTSNNTIYGTQYKADPPCPKGSFLVNDASSDIFSKPIDVTRYGLVYAGAQKNLGPSGVALVIVRDDLIEKPVRKLPKMVQYGVHAAKGSRYNTPPVFGVYMMGLVFKWILAEGGLKTIEARNERKAKCIYDAIDNSGGFYRGHARLEDRSLMNLAFRAPSPELDAAFCEQAKGHKLVTLKGYRTVGGMRASIYNAMPEEGCQALASFMNDFAATNG